MTSGDFDPACPYRNWYSEIGEKASFYSYRACSPFHFLFGTVTHLLCLKAFYSQSKKEHAYVYQVFLTVSELLEVFAWIVYVVGFEWMLIFDKPVWYTSCYICMWFSATMGTFLINVCITMSELFSVCMSADRLYALWKPFKYKSMNTKCNQVVAALVCIFLSVITSVQNALIFGVAPKADNETSYDLSRNFDNPLVPPFTVLRNLVHGGALICLYFCNIGLVWLYHIRQREAAKSLHHSTSKQKKKQEAEKTLALLTISQCTCTTVSTTSTILFDTVIFFWPSFYTCTGPFYMPVRDAFLQVVDMLDFIFMILISRQFRKQIKQEISCKKGNKVTSFAGPSVSANMPVNRH